MSHPNPLARLQVFISLSALVITLGGLMAMVWQSGSYANSSYANPAHATMAQLPISVSPPANQNAPYDGPAAAYVMRIMANEGGAMLWGINADKGVTTGYQLTLQHDTHTLTLLTYPREADAQAATLIYFNFIRGWNQDKTILEYWLHGHRLILWHNDTHEYLYWQFDNTILRIESPNRDDLFRNVLYLGQRFWVIGESVGFVNEL